MFSELSTEYNVMNAYTDVYLSKFPLKNIISALSLKKVGT